MKNRSIQLVTVALCSSMLFMSGLSFGQSNVQKFTPSVLLQRGQFEFNQFNNLYTQTSIRNDQGDKINLGERQSFLTSTFSFLFGVSNFNLGLDVNVNSANYTDDQTSVLSIFNTDASFQRTVVSSIGPRIKFVPLKSVSGLSVQSTFLFPVASDLETPRFVAHDRYTWNTQIFLDKALGSKTRIFSELSFWYRFKRNDFQQNFLRIPASVILSYFPDPKSTVFLLTQHAPAFGNLVGDEQSVFGQIRWYTLVSIGSKYQLTKNLGFEVSYGNFILSRADGAGSVINFGIRFIK